MDNMNLLEIGRDIGMYFVPFLFALCFHEFAHGFVAKICGDDTAERAGRLTLNPVAHADMMGTWILPLMAIIFRTHFMFGWAKPVPVTSRNLRHPRRDMFWVALAGPASNVLLALVSTVLLAVVLAHGEKVGTTGDALQLLLQNFIMVNIFLAVFNLIPVHPLDGAKVAEPFLPIRWNMWLDRNQAQLSMMLFIGVMFAGWIIAIPVQWVVGELFNTAVAIAQRIA